MKENILNQKGHLMKITVETELSLYTLTLIHTENEKFAGIGCFGIFSTYDNARDTLEDIFENFGEKLIDRENTPTGRRYFTNFSTWELEKFKVDELMQ